MYSTGIESLFITLLGRRRLAVMGKPKLVYVYNKSILGRSRLFLSLVPYAFVFVQFCGSM